MSEQTAEALGRVLIVGGGNMGQALCAGLLRIEGVQPVNVSVAEPGEEKRAGIEAALGVATVASAEQALPADTIIIAVKPNVVPCVCQQLAEAGIGGARVVSIAAGVATAKLEAALPQGTPVVRVMPNTPLLVGQGMSAVCGGSQASQGDVQLVREVFASMGKAVILAEDKMDAVTALSGSGPAYFELVCETLSRSAEELGIPYEVGCELAVQTMLGTAQLLTQTGQSLPSAIEAVSSPGGTTVAALGAMREGGLEQALDAGVKAAAKRSAELGA